MSCKPSSHRTGSNRTGAGRLQLTMLAAALAALAAGCTRPPAAQPSESRVLRLGLGGPGEGAQSLIDNLTSDRLVFPGEDGRPEARLAEGWSVSDDRLTWTFTLRSNLKFHDGTLATASVVRDLLEPAVRRVDAGPGFLDIAAMTPTDVRTLVITLHNPSSLLLDDLCGYDLVKKTGRGRVGTGPFLVESASPGVTVLRSFQDYYQGPPSIERLEISSFPAVRTAWAAMMRDEIDFLYEVGREAVEFVEAESSVQVYSFGRPYVHALGFNQRHPVLGRKDVRRALSLAIDRDAVVATALRARGRPAEGPVWPFHWAWDRSGPVYAYDPKAARQMLEHAGFPLRSAGGRQSRLRFTCLIPSGISLFESMGLIVQKQLGDVAVDVEMQAVPFGELVRRFQTGDFDAFLFELASARMLSWPYRFLHSPLPGGPVFLNTGYVAADGALDRIRQARSDDEVRAGLAELQRVLHDDPPAVFISWDERARAVSRRFAIPAQPGRDVWPSLWQWRLSSATTRN